jgi:plastocyanin
MSARLSFVFISVLAACGGDDGGGGKDAAIDSPQSSGIARVDPCPGTVDATVITTGAFSYMPAATTITQGQVVKFTMNAAHDVAALPGTDPTLVVPLGGERCFRFTNPGVFKFKCTPHSFTGMITVN